MSGDFIECQGVVLDQHRGDLYSVDVSIGASTRRVLCRPSGRMRVNRIKITPGDLVQVELSPYDLCRGRIVFRGARLEAA